MIYRYLLAITILTVFSVNNLNAQSFTFVTPKTTITALPNAEIIFDFPIKNLSSQTITVYILRRAQTIPESWSGSMCFGTTCFSPIFDSVATTSDFNSAPILPGDSADFSYHFFADQIPATGTVKLVAKNSANHSDSIVVTLTGITSTSGINDGNNLSGYKLEQNYPNPFNPSTNISYRLESTSDVKIIITNALGQKISEIFSGNQLPGNYSVPFIAKGISSGIYYYTIQITGENSIYSETKKMVLNK